MKRLRKYLALAFGASVLLSMLVSFSLSCIVGLVSFWTTSVFGIVNSKRFIVDFFSGGLVPLALFPEWLGRMARALPFRSVADIPVSLFLGRVAGAGVWRALGLQAFWAALPWGAGGLRWLEVRKEITIRGGQVRVRRYLRLCALMQA